MAEKLDLKTLKKNELVEMLSRQEKLLANKKFLNSLPDKGKKITDMVKQLQQLIARKEELNATMATFQQMRISHAIMDSDDDEEEDVSAPKHHQDKVSSKISKMAEMATPQDSSIEEISVQKTSKVWDYESAVTGPPHKFGRAQMLPIEESLKLQQVQQRRYEEIQAEHATQRLRQQMQGSASHLTLPTTNTSQYRDRNHVDYNRGESEDGEEEREAEETDEEDEAERIYSEED